MTEKNKTMLARVGAAFLGVATILLGAMVVSEIKSYQYIGSNAVEEATISVSGEGEAFAVPDVGEFTVTVEEEADTVPAAQELATEKANNVIAYLEDEGIPEEDVKTTSYNVRPRYEWRQQVTGRPEGERVLMGYVVSQALRVKVQNVDDAGKLLSGVGSFNVSNVSGLNFTVDDEQAVKDEARQQAIADAKEKAKKLADDLGVDLVQVVNFHESGNTPGPMYYAPEGRGGADMAIQESASANVPTGENRFVSNVTITYKIR